MKFSVLPPLSRHNPILIILATLIFSGCSSTPSSDGSDNRDPIEPINRAFWTFTWDYTDKYISKPASLAYTTYTPVFLRSGLYNMALNLNEPSSIINNLLQAKFTNAAKSTGRFVLNSTIGLFGFFDPASDFGWTGDQEEFGEVLGTYGVGDGAYIVVPGIGPSSVREEVGDYIDKYYWPLAVIDFWPNLARWTVIGLEQRAALADQEPLIRESLDDYEFVKNAYFQNMNYKLYDGHPPIVIDEEAEAELDAFMDEFDDE
ncbi:MAG: VacJ family lipoprotein [Colwellia sp.]|nr:VacJ family lipoprotein [Colwellia sp.]